MKYYILTLLTTCFLLSDCTLSQKESYNVKFSKVNSGDLTSDTSSSPSASWHDFNSDGYDDLYVLNGFGTLDKPKVPQKNKLYLNDGNGNFTLIPDHTLVKDNTFSGSSTWADYDNDGDSDVFVANQKNAVNYLYQNQGGGSFVKLLEDEFPYEKGQSFAASWVDIDNDGWLDLYVSNGRSNPKGQKDFLYQNLGNGKFKKIKNNPIVMATLQSGGASWADIDEDGDQDVIIPVNSNSRTPQVFRNDGNWNFTNITKRMNLMNPLPFSPASSVAHWIDYDNDLDIDLFIGNSGGTIDYLYENDGAGNFKFVTAGDLGLEITYVSDVTFGDFDNDGDLDYLNAVWGGASEYFENNGKGEFYQKKASDLGSVINFASSVTANDVDADGDLDVFITQWPINNAGGAPNLLYLNEGQKGNWIKITLEGTMSNRSGIGAKIIVTANIHGKETNQLRLLSSLSSWRSTTTLTQHFGLGDAKHIEKIKIIWPSGHVDEIIKDIPVNQELFIKENQGIIK